MIIFWLFAAYAAVILLFSAWGAMIVVRFKGTLTPHALPEQPPSVTFVVPARNEAHNIGRCLRGLTGQDYPNFDIVVVDDESTDATPQILGEWQARDGRIKVVRTDGKPEGWNGKQNACYQGALAARGDWLCFMDADTYAEPCLLSRTVAFALANGVDVLTLQPWYEMVGFWERVLLPNMLSILYIFPPHKVNDPNHSMAIANGQFIMMPRDVYEAIGGHAAVRDKMMDDFALAEVVKRGGYHLFMADGSQVMRVRLYHNLGEIWAGALKSAVEITGGWRMTIAALIATFFVNVLSVILLVWAIVLGSGPLIALSGGAVALLVICQGLIRVLAFRVPIVYGLSFPLSGVIVTILILDGMFRLGTGRGVHWKDRKLIGTPGVSTPRVVRYLRNR